jgi:NTP pyrophosphatase (non-canonical NTP hydrolase)
VSILIDVLKMQDEVGKWAERNFGGGPSTHPLLGIVEEVGELSHAHLKEEQGIRGTKEEHEEEARDALGDIMIYMLDYAYRRGWDLGDILTETWDNVRKRDWIADAQSGGEEK